jgi:hypothetical protein
MLAAEYGADITYGEEIIDHRLLRCTRKINSNASYFWHLFLMDVTLDTKKILQSFQSQTCLKSWLFIVRGHSLLFDGCHATFKLWVVVEISL